MEGSSAHPPADWRAQLLPLARERIVRKILESLRRIMPVAVPEGLIELQRIATRFEDKIFTVATSQSDYLRKISLKMLSMENNTYALPGIRQPSLQHAVLPHAHAPPVTQQPSLQQALPPQAHAPPAIQQPAPQQALLPHAHAPPATQQPSLQQALLPQAHAPFAIQQHYRQQALLPQAHAPPEIQQHYLQYAQPPQAHAPPAVQQHYLQQALLPQAHAPLAILHSLQQTLHPQVHTPPAMQQPSHQQLLPSYFPLVIQQPSIQQALIPQEPNSAIEMQQQHRLPFQLPSMQLQPFMPQGNPASDGMVQQQNNIDQQRHFIRAQRDLQGASCSSHLFDQVPLRSSKKPCGNDRISNLPDALLHHIMSFLPAQEVVRMSVLSPRWRHLWASALCLDIDVEQFYGDRRRFGKFVNCLLLLRHAAPLDIFCLRSLPIDRTNSWIDYAIKHNVRVIKFSQDIDWESLKLDHKNLNFTSRYLRHLVLVNVSLDATVFAPLNNACPVLKILELRESYLDVPEMSSSSLMTLYITHCCLLQDLLICTPRLESLFFRSPRYRAASLKKLTSLTTAIITLDDCLHMLDEEEDEEEILGDYSILDGLSHARSMELLAPLGEVAFDREMRRCPMFNNLTSLTLGEWCTSADFHPLICFLRRSPVLEKLTLKLNKELCVHCHELGPIVLPKGGSFTADHLKKVTINCLQGDGRIDILVKMLRANAKSLKEVNIIQSKQSE